MNIALLIPWILAFAIVSAVSWYAVHNIRDERARGKVLQQEIGVRDEALEYFATTTLPAVAEAVRQYQQPTIGPEVPPELQNSRFTQSLNWIIERVADDISVIRTETREHVAAEADEQLRNAVAVAQESAQAESATAQKKVEASARDATSAAVRSFGTSVVSLGADVSQVVSSALRDHRDDDMYETLIRIDHTVQQMIRQAQSYVIVCGGLPGRRWPAQTLTDVVGGAIGRVRDYLRVRANQLDRVVISRAVEPLVHTLAAIIDNALRYSPPTSYVDVGFQVGHHGVTVIVDDAGVRMNPEQMEEARQLLANERTVDILRFGAAPKVGFPGIAALARRYGFTVYIDGPNAFGGMRAMVYIPEALLVAPEQNNPPVDTREPIPTSSSLAPVTAMTGMHTQTAMTGRPEMTAGATPTGGATMTRGSDEFDGVSSAVSDITTGGLPKRRRRALKVPVGGTQQGSGATAPQGQARPDVAAAWQNGSKSGRAALSDNTEGMNS